MKPSRNVTIAPNAVVNPPQPRAVTAGHSAEEDAAVAQLSLVGDADRVLGAPGPERRTHLVNGTPVLGRAEQATDADEARGEVAIDALTAQESREHVRQEVGRGRTSPGTVPALPRRARPGVLVGGRPHPGCFRGNPRTALGPPPAWVQRTPGCASLSQPIFQRWGFPSPSKDSGSPLAVPKEPEARGLKLSAVIASRGRPCIGGAAHWLDRSFCGVDRKPKARWRPRELDVTSAPPKSCATTSHS